MKVARGSADRWFVEPFLTLTSPRAGATAARSQHVHPCAALHRRPNPPPPPPTAGRYHRPQAHSSASAPFSPTGPEFFQSAHNDARGGEPRGNIISRAAFEKHTPPLSSARPRTHTRRGATWSLSAPARPTPASSPVNSR